MKTARISKEEEKTLKNINPDILNDKERLAVKMRLERRIYSDIGKELGCSTQRAQQLIKDSIRKSNSIESKELIDVPNKKKGIAYDKTKNCWLSYISFDKQQFSLGTYETEDMAWKARLEAEKVLEGDFTGWYEIRHPEIVKRKNKIKETRGVNKNQSGNYWRAQIGFDNQVYNLGNYELQEDAIRARKEAEKHIGPDFCQWYIANYPVYWKNLQDRIKE
jgi:AP2 domain.